MATPTPQSNLSLLNPLMQTPATMGIQPGTTSGANPMQDMMQQMMQNPAMMQQSMQMAQQMSGGSGMGMGMQPATPFGGSSTVPGANPMQDMMQQMMQNPAMMQQSMQMAQQMFGGGGMGMGMQPTPPIGTGDTTTPTTSTPQAMTPNPSVNSILGGMQPPGAFPTATATPMTEQMHRIRFASQLTQLTMMGFSNEAACLHALAQHNGRVDAAIDTLLSSGEGSH
jgi:ubiquilin